MLLAAGKDNFNIVGTIDLDNYKDSLEDLYLTIASLRQAEYLPDQRIIISSTVDYYTQSTHGILLQSLQTIVNAVDISNFFICFITTNVNIKKEYQYVLDTFSTDLVPFEIQIAEGKFSKLDGDIQPYRKINNFQINDIAVLEQEQKDLLFNSKNFCILPWISVMVGTDSEVTPCCAYEGDQLGDCSTHSLESIWNNTKSQNLRAQMLEDKTINGCSECIKLENLGKRSLRNSMNVTFSKHINVIKQGATPEYNIKYIDSRFNNLCNLGCRSCFHGASSSWHAPSVALGLIDKSTPVFLKAGRNTTDLFDQVVDQIDNLDRIYFAGGEPIIINDNWRILDELDRRGHHDIELIYNTNMNQSKLKGRSIFDAWKNFKNISIGASLDAEGSRGEYLRTGTVWSKVIDFRKQLLEQRPDIDFYVSCTTSIINVLHVPDFHRSWVDKGLIQPEQFNIQTLLQPEWMCINTAPLWLRKQIIEKYQQHLLWLKPLDSHGRATYGFESIIEQLNDFVEFDPQLFWNNILPLDEYYNANLLDNFPELVDLPR